MKFTAILVLLSVCLVVGISGFPAAQDPGWSWSWSWFWSGGMWANPGDDDPNIPGVKKGSTAPIDLENVNCNNIECNNDMETTTSSPDYPDYPLVLYNLTLADLEDVNCDNRECNNTKTTTPETLAAVAAPFNECGRRAVWNGERCQTIFRG